MSETTDTTATSTQEKPVKRNYTRKDATTRAREARDTAKKKHDGLKEKYDEAVAEAEQIARKYETARQDYAYKAANPLLAGDDVESVPQPLSIASALVGADVPAGVKSKPVAAETLVGSDGKGTSTSSNLLDEEFDGEAQADKGNPLDRDEPSEH